MIIDAAASDGWALISADAAGVKPNVVTAVYAQRIASWQRSDGHWSTTDDRPPQSFSEFTATAAALQALQLYMPPQLAKETGERVARARAWLATAQPRDTEDHVFRLFGLYWAGAGAADTDPAARELLALQRPNGGWAQLPHMQPDAYATGEALVALAEAGSVPTVDAAWQKGLQFLLSTQEDSGGWHVRTRMLSPAPVSPPYMESGFPHSHDQYISTDATCWAAMALMMALPRAGVPATPAPLPSLVPSGVQPWMERALFGTPADLQAQLDTGLDSNSKTAEGTTLAMMVAHDARKLKILIDRGADVSAKAKTGITALMVATTYAGTAESVKLLLDHGAEARPGTGVQLNASPLFLAVIAGDRENVELLLAKGADPNRKMNVLGFLPTSPLLFAIGYDDPALIRVLVAAGANVHEKDNDGMTALDWAAIAHHAGTVKALLATGAAAHINDKDRFGYTPLLYASAVDFGDAEIASILLRAGADPNIGDKDGETPAAHARDYPYLRAALERVPVK
jgi:ankyrin repeat protein